MPRCDRFPEWVGEEICVCGTREGEGLYQAHALPGLCPGSLGGCSSVKSISSSSGGGEPVGEGGKGYGVSPMGSWRMAKAGFGFHPILGRLLGRRRGRVSPGGRTGREAGMRVG